MYANYDKVQGRHRNTVYVALSAAATGWQPLLVGIGSCGRMGTLYTAASRSETLGA